MAAVSRPYHPSAALKAEAGRRLHVPRAREHLDSAWERLSAAGTALMPLQEYPFSKHYGWIQDRYGLSWQIVPVALDGMLSRGTGEQAARVTQAFLKMKKFDIAVLEAAFNGE